MNKTKGVVFSALLVLATPFAYAQDIPCDYDPFSSAFVCPVGINGTQPRGGEPDMDPFGNTYNSGGGTYGGSAAAAASISQFAKKTPKYCRKQDEQCAPWSSRVNHDGICNAWSGGNAVKNHLCEDVLLHINSGQDFLQACLDAGC